MTSTTAYRSRRPAPQQHDGPRPNRFPGACVSCQNQVPAGAGELIKRDGAWAVRHIGECPEKLEAALYPATEAGIYRNPANGDMFAVKIGKQSQRPYAMRLLEFSGQRLMLSGQRRQIKQEFDRDAIRIVDATWMVSKAEGEAFAEITGQCVRCHRILRDADSVEAAKVNGGYGPDCVKLAG